MDICLPVHKINPIGRSMIVAFWCLFPFISSAQERKVPKWTLSAQVLANYSHIPDFRDIYMPGTNFGLGLVAQHQFKPRVDFMMGAGVNGHAYGRNSVDSAELFIQRVREYYLDIPMGLYYYPSRSERTWGIMVGVTPSFLLHKQVNKPERNPDYSTIPRDPSESGRLDVSLYAGAGIKLNPRWAMSARYTYSLTSKQNEAYNSGRFSTVSIGVSYQLTAPDRNESPKELAKTADIIHLDKRNMVVLVRLKTEAKKISYLEGKGYTTQANEIKEAVAEENLLTLEAFRQSFNFCEVLYFYDTSSTYLAAEQYEGHVFNDEGIYTDSLINDSCDILVAEFGSPYSEAFGSSSGFGLVVYDRFFNQMKEPFPYYVSNFYGLVSRVEVVARFDKRIREYQKLR